ncbi:hemin uptake protein HemP [Roseimaritima ulvae]|uniref:Hemin uptake protein hemP n=1 Tax=Roseimaritima ulvae TaxID=980254 RepID=A0A5B9QM74_9BACT|nr:hemin uptake protein HemP [Roseimaritima ulvae]QEG39159.1 hypothetical protein UC8_11200 [Roseimaritima ulvae]
MTIPNDQPDPDAKPTPASEAAWSTHIASKIVRFKDLSRCGDEIWIEHDGQLYRLRETRQGKLILTK